MTPRLRAGRVEYVLAAAMTAAVSSCGQGGETDMMAPPANALSETQIDWALGPEGSDPAAVVTNGDEGPRPIENEPVAETGPEEEQQ